LTFTVRSNAQRTSIAVRKFLSRRSVYRGREGLKGERESWKKPTNLIGQIDEGHLALLRECEEKREGGSSRELLRQEERGTALYDKWQSKLSQICQAHLASDGLTALSRRSHDKAQTKYHYIMTKSLERSPSRGGSSRAGNCRQQRPGTVQRGRIGPERERKTCISPRVVIKLPKPFQ
jgi:hypothetical protein